MACRGLEPRFFGDEPKEVTHTLTCKMRIMGLEPILSAWKAPDLPINLYPIMRITGFEPVRISSTHPKYAVSTNFTRSLNGAGRIRTHESMIT